MEQLITSNFHITLRELMHTSDSRSLHADSRQTSSALNSKGNTLVVPSLYASKGSLGLPDCG